MRARVREIIVWSVVPPLVAIAALRWQRAGNIERQVVSGPPPRSAVEPDQPVDSLVSIGGRIVANDPFRLERRPTAVPFMAEPPAPPEPAPPNPPPRPDIRVTGIAGPPWQAILEGVPDREGSLIVRPGQTIAGLRVRRIDRHTVVIAGHDTTWTLTVRRPWH